MHDMSTVNKAADRAGYAGECGYSYRNTPCLALFLFFLLLMGDVETPENMGSSSIRGNFYTPIRGYSPQSEAE